MITFYHSPNSRSTRVLSLIHELDARDRIEVREVTIARVDGSGGPDPANPHPDGKVPMLDCDGELVWETAAIMLTLTELFPQNGLGVAPGEAGRGRYLSWMAWYAGVMEPVTIHAAAGLEHPFLDATFRGVPQVVDRLSAALDEGPWLMGERFTAADILCHSPYAWFPEATPDVPAIRDWVARCADRPAARRARETDAAAA